jgi:hypothetical protein
LLRLFDCLPVPDAAPANAVPLFFSRSIVIEALNQERVHWSLLLEESRLGCCTVVVWNWCFCSSWRDWRIVAHGYSTFFFADRIHRPPWCDLLGSSTRRRIPLRMHRIHLLLSWQRWMNREMICRQVANALWDRQEGE